MSNINKKPGRQSNFDLAELKSLAFRKHPLWILLGERWKRKYVHYINKSHGITVRPYDLFAWLSVFRTIVDSSHLLFKTSHFEHGKMAAVFFRQYLFVFQGGNNDLVKIRFLFYFHFFSVSQNCVTVILQICNDIQKLLIQRWHTLCV